MADYNSTDLKFILSNKIIEEFGECKDLVQINSPKLFYPDLILDIIAKKLKNNSTVLLVDEYDAPLTHNIDNPDDLNQIKKVLNSFYATIKQYTDKFRLIFITGVTCASHVSIFSAFNNLTDLSLNKQYNSLLGFTQNELEQYFDSYVENASQILNMTKNDTYKRLEQYYDGYMFSINANETVYNPWSILSFFKLHDEGFTNYWFESGGSPSIITQYLKINDSFDFLDYNTRDIFVPVNNISKKFEITNIPREILFYQTGYFTIRDEHDGTAHLVFPNIEVEESLLMLYLDENNLNTSHELNQKIKDIQQAIDSRNLIFIIDMFNAILNECVSSSSKIFEDERAVRDIIYAELIKIPMLQQIKERDTAKGKADFELITSKTCMIIEFKSTSSTRGPEASLKQAIEQVKKNRYGLLFSQNYALYRVAMIISTEEKKILPKYCREIL